MNTGDFLKNMAGKIGKTNDAALNEFVNRQDTQGIEIPDELCNIFMSELMSLEGAKNNSKVKAYFFSQALNGMDFELASAIDDFGLDTSIFADEKDTYAKMRTFKTKLKELMDKKPEKAGELEKMNAELQKKHNEVQRQLADALEKHKLEKADIQAEANNQVLNHMRLSSLKGLNWANKDQPEDVQIELAKLLMSRALESAGVKEVNENGNIILKMTDDNTLRYFENGKEVDYDSFKNKVLADNKLLAVTESKPNVPPVQPAIPGQGWQQSNAKVAAVFAQAKLRE